MFFGRVKMWAAMAGAFLVALAGAYFRGKSSAVASAERKRLKGYVDTRKRIDEVDVGDDTGVLRDWLRDRGQR